LVLVQAWHTPLYIRNFPYSGSEVEAALETDHEGVGVLARPTWSDDVLHVRLQEEGISEKPKAIGPLQRALIALHSNRWIQLLGAPLRVLQVVAEVPKTMPKPPTSVGRDPETPRTRTPAVKKQGIWLMDLSGAMMSEPVTPKPRLLRGSPRRKSTWSNRP
jgi:hypothetical protein